MIIRYNKFVTCVFSPTRKIRAKELWAMFGTFFLKMRWNDPPKRKWFRLYKHYVKITSCKQAHGQLLSKTNSNFKQCHSRKSPVFGCPGLEKKQTRNWRGQFKHKQVRKTSPPSSQELTISRSLACWCVPYQNRSVDTSVSEEYLSFP